MLLVATMRGFSSRQHFQQLIYRNEYSMAGMEIILTVAIFLTGCMPGARPLTPVAQPVIVTEAPGPYLQPSPTLVQPVGPPAMPAFPPQTTMVPLPSHTPGSIFGPPATAAPSAASPPATAAAPALSPLADFAPGGTMSPQFGLPSGPDLSAGVPNPLSVPVTDDAYAWGQLADVVSDYFPIAREQRARRGEVFSEGFIETAPQGGATWLEHHRGDSVGAFNRWESTFQTIRRKALVRVMPGATGYHIEVIVEKELENLPQPQRATAGAASFQNDQSLPSSRSRDGLGRLQPTVQWIRVGRDVALEQRMLADIHARLCGATTGSTMFAP